MSDTASVTRFPDAIWDVAVLRGLDARARTEIEAAGRLRELAAGATVYRAGEPADAVFVVAEGRVALSATRRGEAEASVIRKAGPREIFGEEATLESFGVRQLEARCEARSVVAEVPIVVLRRALGRLDKGGEAAARLERSLRRAATLDLLKTTSFTRTLPERELEIVLDAASHVGRARGEAVYREGDSADAAFLVADGLLQAQTDDDDKPRVEAYLSRGDLFGDDELEARDRRRLSVVALGPTRLVAIPRDIFVQIARKNRGDLDRARRLRTDALPPNVGGATTAHVFKDLYRMRVARSLLVINQDACVRCGHCAWSCASVHDDGISRLVRRGDKVVVDESAEKAVPLLVPNSCQHCKNPSCMIDCPTGAISRDARGEVFIREDLCTGCGNCAKGCPWDNIQIAPRKKTTAVAPFPEVAVKCDLCSGLPSGPACVAACPTEAIARIDPNTAIPALRAPAGGGVRATVFASATASAPSTLPRRRPAWPWLAGAAAACAGAPFVRATPMATGVVLGVVVVLLASYAAIKRAPTLLVRVKAHGIVRVAYIAHLALGVVGVGALVAHVGAKAGDGAAFALTVAMIVALATGGWGALVQRFVPPMLARLERKSVLPEELGAGIRAHRERLFGALSGKSEVVKALFAKRLRPYVGSTVGPIVLVASGVTLRAEERRIRAELEGLVEKRTDKLGGLDELVRLVVEHRALRAQRLLSFVLRGWLVVHLVAVAAVAVLLVAHVVGVTRSP